MKVWQWNGRMNARIPLQGKRYYAISYNSDFDLNDSLEKIREWGTAKVYGFTSIADRDAFVDSHHLNRALPAADARTIGAFHQGNDERPLLFRA